MNNKKIGLAIVGIIILGGVFYGGMVYGARNVRASLNSRGANFGQNGTLGMLRGNRNMGGFVNGKILNKDANSITLELSNGNTASPASSGSKIIFLDSNTKIAKSVTGTAADLTLGADVSITGTPNTDGSLNAQSVQIRLSTPPMVR